MWTYLLVLLIVAGSLLAVLGILAFLGRFRGGRYLRPIIETLARVPFMRRLFEKASTSMMERQNPELASAVAKLQRLAGRNPDPQRAQQALSQLSPAERRAYLDFVQQQGALSEGQNRQMRRRQGRLQAPPAGPPRRGGGKRRR